MDRMTKRIPGLSAVPGTFAIDFVFGMDCKETKAFTDFCNRLADYEDTGLTPEEITAMAAKLRQIEEEKT